MMHGPHHANCHRPSAPWTSHSDSACAAEKGKAFFPMLLVGVKVSSNGKWQPHQTRYTACQGVQGIAVKSIFFCCSSLRPARPGKLRPREARSRRRGDRDSTGGKQRGRSQLSPQQGLLGGRPNLHCHPCRSCEALRPSPHQQGREERSGNSFRPGRQALSFWQASSRNGLQDKKGKLPPPASFKTILFCSKSL